MNIDMCCIEITKIYQKLKTAFAWLFSTKPIQKSPSDEPFKTLLDSMKITANCRFNASNRLKYINKFSLFTVTYLSLGLILIPLIQNTDIPLGFPPKVLNLMQVFIAVAVLVYSTINATARYDARSIALNQCGDKIKDLIRTLRRNLKDPDILSDIQEKYNDAVKDSENHTRLDYLRAQLEKKDEFNLTGIVRLLLISKYYILFMFPFLVPSLMILIETIFILDMVGATSILSKYLGGVRVQN